MRALIAIGLSAGCIQTAGGGGFGDDVGDDGLAGDADADTDFGGDADADGDADGDADTDTGEPPPTCPAYPSGPYGLRTGNVVQNIALPGSDSDDEWTMEDFWCMANDTREKTVLILNIHSMT